MHVIAVFHHCMVNKFCSRESRLIKPGVLLWMLLLEVTVGNKRQDDGGATEQQGGREGSADHMPRLKVKDKGKGR